MHVYFTRTGYGTKEKHGPLHSGVLLYFVYRPREVNRQMNLGAMVALGLGMTLLFSGLAAAVIVIIRKESDKK